MAEAGRFLRDVSVLPSDASEDDGGRRVVPHLPLELDREAQSRLSERTGSNTSALYAARAARLDAAGLWDRLQEQLRAQERRHVELTGDDLRHGLDYRDRQFFADGEELSERGVEHLLDELAPSLAECGLALDVVVLSDPYHAPPPGSEGSDEYRLEINGVRCPVWTLEDELQHGDRWYASTVRPLVVINELLGTVGARERVYAELGADCIYLLPMEARAVLTDPEVGRWSQSGLLLMERSLWHAEP
jgi:hypothetical protein